MERIEDISEQLERLRETRFLSVLGSQVMRPLTGSLRDLVLELTSDEDFFASRVWADRLSLDFVYWLGPEERFSLFIHDREVIDENLETRAQAEELAADLLVMLSNRVQVTDHVRDSDGQLLKRDYHYEFKVDGDVQNVVETQRKSWAIVRSGDSVRKEIRAVVLLR